MLTKIVGVGLVRAGARSRHLEIRLAKKELCACGGCALTL